MLIACDVDGVIADLHVEWLRRYNADFDDNLTVDRIVGWGMEAFVKPQCGKKIFDYLHHPDLYAHVPPTLGALQGVAALRAAGHTVYFATSCGRNMVDQKAEWLVRHGFSEPPRGDRLPLDMVVAPTEHKAQYLQADLIIDDSAETVREWTTQTRRRAIVLEQPWNANMDLPSMFWQWCRRAHSWAEVVEHVNLWSNT